MNRGRIARWRRTPDRPPSDRGSARTASLRAQRALDAAAAGDANDAVRAMKAFSYRPDHLTRRGPRSSGMGRDGAAGRSSRGRPSVSRGDGRRTVRQRAALLPDDARRGAECWRPSPNAFDAAASTDAALTWLRCASTSGSRQPHADRRRPRAALPRRGASTYARHRRHRRWPRPWPRRWRRRRWRRPPRRCPRRMPILLGVVRLVASA